jgi:hypothetical protein
MRETPTDQIPLVGPTLDAAIRNGILSAKAAEEKKLRAHLEAHTVENWAAAVVQLTTRAEAAERAGEAIAEADRWKVQLPNAAIKGISEQDARRIAEEHRGTVFRSTVTLYADGGEYLAPWEPA